MFYTHKILSVFLLLVILSSNLVYVHADTTGIQPSTVHVAGLPKPLTSTLPTVVTFHPTNPTAFAAAKNQSTTTQYAQKVVTPVPGPAPYVETNIASVGSVGIEGINQTQSGGFTPPDVAMGVGPDHVVEFINDAGEIWDKNGNVVQTAFDLHPFFSNPSATDFLSDPRVMFDPSSGHWFASILDVTNSSVIVAVSADNNPTHAWQTYNIQFGGVSPTPVNACPDQPKIGVSTDKFVVAGNDYSNNCGISGLPSFLGADFFVIDKSQMISGAPITNISHFGPDLTKGGILSVPTMSTTKLYMVSVDGMGSTKLHLFTLTGIPNALHTGVTKTVTDLTVRAINEPPNGIEPTSPTDFVNTDDSRVQDAKWNSNKLWVSLTDACKPAGDTVSRSCDRFIQLNTAVSPATVLQDFDIGFNHESLYYPAISIEGSGTVDMMSGFSSSTFYPSLLVTGQSSVGAPNTYQQPVVIVSGTQPVTGVPGVSAFARYGDYFSSALDPSNSTKSWVAGEYIHLPGLGSYQWSTFITSTSTTNPILSLNVTSGTVRSPVNVTGAFFDDTSATKIFYNGILRKTIATDANGNFTTILSIPSSTFGAHPIAATDASGNTLSTPFSVTPSVTLNPTSGPVATVVTVTANGFAASSSTQVKYDGVTKSTMMTNSTGSLKTTLTVPKSSFGTHTISATDALSHTASASFGVVPSLTLSQNSGPVGTLLTVTGNGFASSLGITLTFNSITQATPTSNSTGSFKATFTVPQIAGGPWSVGASDGSNTASSSFTVIPKLTLSTSGGPGGTPVTVNGTGFVASSTTTIKYNGVTKITTSTGTTGSFSSLLSIPSIPAGTNTIDVSDLGGDHLVATFLTGAPTTNSLSDLTLQIWNLLLFIQNQLTNLNGSVGHTNQVVDNMSANQMSLQTIRLSSPVQFGTSFPNSTSIAFSCDKDFTIKGLKVVTEHDNPADKFSIDQNSMLLNNTIHVTHLIHPAFSPAANTDISNDLIGLVGGSIGVNATETFKLTVNQTAGAGSADSIDDFEAIVESNGASCSSP